MLIYEKYVLNYELCQSNLIFDIYVIIVSVCVVEGLFYNKGVRCS